MPLKLSALARRRWLSSGFASATIVALCAYLSVLWSARAGWYAELRPDRAVQVFGSHASVSGHAILEPMRGSVAFKFDGTARWRIPEPSPKGDARRSIVIVSEAMSFADRTGDAYVVLDGEPVTALRTVDFGSVNVPPGNAYGFRLAIPAGSPCLSGPCDLELRVRRGYWRVYRVALVDDDPIASAGEFR